MHSISCSCFCNRISLVDFKPMFYQFFANLVSSCSALVYLYLFPLTKDCATLEGTIFVSSSIICCVTWNRANKEESSVLITNVHCYLPVYVLYR